MSVRDASRPRVRPRHPAEGVPAAVLLLFLSGCYRSHGPSPDAAVPPDAPLPEASPLDGGGPDGPDASSLDDAGPTCDGVAAELDLGGEPGCVSATVPTAPRSITCAAGGLEIAGAGVQIRNAFDPAQIHVLVRSVERSRRICWGLPSLDDCDACTELGCATGGDLTRSGVGSVIAAAGMSTVRIVVDNDGAPAWVRVCSPPM